QTLRNGTPGKRSALSGVIAEIGRQVALVLETQLRAADVDPTAAEPWAFGIVGMVHLAGDWWITTKTMPRERLVDYLTVLLWDGRDNAGPTIQAGGGRPRSPSLDRDRVVEPRQQPLHHDLAGAGEEMTLVGQDDQLTVARQHAHGLAGHHREQLVAV